MCTPTKIPRLLSVWVPGALHRFASAEAAQELLEQTAAGLGNDLGAMFPLSGLPVWLSTMTRINPLTYAVDPLRRTVFAAQHLPPAALQRFPTGVELFGHTLGTPTELTIVATFAAVFLTLAVRAFSTTK